MFFIAFVNGWAVSVAWPAALGSPAALVLGARQVEAPSPVIGAFELGVDEAVDCLVTDDFAPCFMSQASGDLLG